MTRPPVISDRAVTRLRHSSIDPRVVAALGLVEVEDGTFVVPYARDGEPPVHRAWEVGAEPEPWPAGKLPGLWWPVGREGSTAIVCLGATDALFLTSRLFAVGFDGALWRRPDLPAVFSQAVPVALPRTRAFASPEWYADPLASAPALVAELADAEKSTAILAVPRAPAPDFRVFLSEFLVEGSEREDIETFLALLPHEATWASLLKGFPGAAKRAALDAIFTYQLQTHEGGP